jgi:Phage terminase large subunit
MPNLNITDFYVPLPKQELYHQSMAPFRLHVGGFGSGKTLNALMEAIITCLMVPGCNCLILRTTSPDIQKTVINKFLNPKLVPRWVYKTYNKNEKIAYFENGSQLHFGYCQRDDDVNQYLSTEYVYIHLEEAGEFSYRIFEVLVGRARLSSDVVDVYGNKVKPSIGLTTNPMGNGWGWIKSLFKNHEKIKGMGHYDPADYFMVHSTVYDNPYVCTPEYIKKLEAMTGTLRQQALYGDMDTIGGQYYPQFNTGQHEGIHVMNPKDIRFKSYEPVWCGSDWGLAHHWPVIWFTKGQIKDPLASSGSGYRTVTVAFRERIFQEMNAIQVADGIAEACDCDRDDHGRIRRVKEPIKRFFFSWDRFKRHEQNHTIAQQLGDRMIKYGLPRPQPADSSRVDGWVLIAQLFDMDELVITTDCPHLISTIPMLVRDAPDDPEDVKKVEGMEDDIADAFRYGVKSYLNPGKMPQSLKDAQMLDQIKDPVAQRIRAYEMYIKKQQKPAVVQDTRVLPWQRGHR